MLLKLERRFGSFKDYYIKTKSFQCSLASVCSSSCSLPLQLLRRLFHMAQRELARAAIFWQAYIDLDTLLPLMASFWMGLLLWRGGARTNNAEPPLLLLHLCCELFELQLQKIRTEKGVFGEERFEWRMLLYRLMQPSTGCQSQPLPCFPDGPPLLWTVKNMEKHIVLWNNLYNDKLKWELLSVMLRVWHPQISSVLDIQLWLGQLPPVIWFPNANVLNFGSRKVATARNLIISTLHCH